MASKSLARQIFRSVQSLRCKRSLSSIASKTSSSQNYLLNGGTVSIPQIYFAQQYSSKEVVIPIVSYEDIKKLPKQPEKLLVDVREPNELAETGQIPTSINIPLGLVSQELGPNFDAGAFKAKYGREKPQPNTDIIFHCRIGKRSNNAAKIANGLGYHNVKNYLGSWLEWAEKEGLPK